MRDISTHRKTIPEHWYRILQPTAYNKDDVDIENFVPNGTIVESSYDPNCLDENVSDGCHPMAIISAERLQTAGWGASETRKIAKVLDGKRGISDYLIDEDAWDCIWEELIVNKKGVKTFIDREGIEERDYNFSALMLQDMVTELERLITKHSEPEWFWRETSRSLVGLLQEHKVLLEEELQDVLDGTRQLKPDDFLGAESRKKIEAQNRVDSGDMVDAEEVRELNTIDFSDYFRKLEAHILDERRQKMRETAVSAERKRVLRRDPGGIGTLQREGTEREINTVEQF